MDFLELAKGRYSVRSFSDKKVEAEKIAKILFAVDCCTYSLQQSTAKDLHTSK